MRSLPYRTEPLCVCVRVCVSSSSSGGGEPVIIVEILQQHDAQARKKQRVFQGQRRNFGPLAKSPGTRRRGDQAGLCTDRTLTFTWSTNKSVYRWCVYFLKERLADGWTRVTGRTRKQSTIGRTVVLLYISQTIDDRMSDISARVFFLRGGRSA